MSVDVRTLKVVLRKPGRLLEARTKLALNVVHGVSHDICRWCFYASNVERKVQAVVLI
jgi:hypothetical protein